MLLDKAEIEQQNELQDIDHIMKYCMIGLNSETRNFGNLVLSDFVLCTDWLWVTGGYYELFVFQTDPYIECNDYDRNGVWKRLLSVFYI